MFFKRLDFPACRCFEQSNVCVKYRKCNLIHCFAFKCFTCIPLPPDSYWLIMPNEGEFLASTGTAEVAKSQSSLCPLVMTLKWWGPTRTHCLTFLTAKPEDYAIHCARQMRHNTFKFNCVSCVSQKNYLCMFSYQIPAIF